MNKRPYISKRIDELEKVFKAAGSDGQTLHMLESELVHRKTPRAVNLLRKVRKLLANPSLADGGSEPTLFDSRSHQATAPIFASEPKEQGLKSSTGFTLRPSEAPKPTVTPTRRESVPPHQPIRHSAPIPFPQAIEQVRPSALGQSVSLEDACRILHVTLGSDWETIEKARSQIVQHSHPDLIKGLSEEKRRELVRAAKMANTAAKTLLNSRISDEPSSTTSPEETGPPDR